MEKWNNTFIETLFMEKILLAIDSQNVDANAVRFACYLTRLTNSKLTGIFLENIVIAKEIVISQTEETTSVESISITESIEDNIAIRDANIRLFKHMAGQEGVKAFVEVDNGIPEIDIISKTRFADILIVDARTSFSGMYEGLPTRFVKDILNNAECPVVIAPQTFSSIDNIVFCYSGSKSSVFAIKQFTYLFPEFKNKRVKIIDLNAESEIGPEEVQTVTAWLTYHYHDVEFVRLEGDVTEAFFNYLLKKKNDFVVMGAFGRGLLASFFENDAEDNGRTTSLPVFVAHY